MKLITFFLSFILSCLAFASAQFNLSLPTFKGVYDFKGAQLCATAKQTLAYLNKNASYDPQVIHDGKALKIPLERVKATLIFICQNQANLNDPNFIKKHFDFIRWSPDVDQAKQLSANKPLLIHLPNDRILMTKYFVHMAKVSLQKSNKRPFPLHALPQDEQGLSIEEADVTPQLTRFKYGKQDILKGKLSANSVPVLAYMSRKDLETALLQGSVVADFGGNLGKKIFNVHRNNHIAYDRSKSPESQERYWYFKQVGGIKGYGKDAEHKITVNPEVTFAADLEQLGLGKMLMIQYSDKSGTLISRAGILADTGGAFASNLYQVDYLAGSYPGTSAFNQATRHLPDYVDAYFMVLKK
jgi:hypothetical protein